MYIKHYCKGTEPGGGLCSARRDHRQSLLLQRFADHFDPFSLLIFVPIFIYFLYHRCLLKGVCSRVSNGNTPWLNLSLHLLVDLVKEGNLKAESSFWFSIKIHLFLRPATMGGWELQTYNPVNSSFTILCEFYLGFWA